MCFNVDKMANKKYSLIELKCPKEHIVKVCLDCQSLFRLVQLRCLVCEPLKRSQVNCDVCFHNIDNVEQEITPIYC